MASVALKRWAVPSIPFALSLALSLSTVGRHPFWQDSGLYLTAIKELGILYPPGFVLYEGLCFLWTRALFFVDFTLAMHLFSSLCAALTAGVTAVATRDLLRARGRIFRVLPEDPGELADACGILSGVLLAGGFTFWSTAIYAKVYCFYYLMLALLLWRMIRADESGRPRDLAIVAVLIGLSWQAHPSASMTGLALLLFVGSQATSAGWKGVLGGTALAALAALGPALVLLPVYLSLDPWLTFGRPTGVVEFLRYIAGARYVGEHGAFGFDAVRAASWFRFLWEDLLGIGLLSAGLGLAWIARQNIRLFIGLLAWVLPFSLFTILFKTEVQHDCWFVAARMPLILAAGVGACVLALRAGERARWWIGAAGAAATVWAVAVNFPDVAQRDYLMAEHYGRIVLEPVDRDAILILGGDDANGLASYLQRVRGERPDVILVTGSFLCSGAATGNYWYEASLFKRHPALIRPEYAGLRERHPGVELKQAATAAFINANADEKRPIFCGFMVSPDLLRPDLLMIPAGVNWKLVRREAVPPVDVRYWKFPIEPEQIRPLYRRARGQIQRPSGGVIQIRPERYERRLAALILLARFHLALAQFEAGRFALAARLCQSIIDYDDEEFESNPEIIYLLGISSFAAGELEKAEKALRISAESSPRKDNRATALVYLGEIEWKRGNGEAARRHFDAALAVPGLNPAMIRTLEARIRSR